MVIKTALRLAVAVSLTPLLASAADVPAPTTAAKPADWIKQLNSADYQTRSTASRELHKLGKAAISAIAAAAETDDPELSARCLSLLKSLYDSKDAATKAAAEKTLKQLAKSSNAVVAKRATDATRKPIPVPTVNPFGNRLVMLGGFRGRVQIQQIKLPIAPARVAVRRAPRQQIIREGTIKENGKTIHIKQSLAGPKREIVIKVTERVNGKDTTTEYKARTASDLRKTHPKAYELYRKHAGKLKVGIGNAGAAVLPVVIAPPAIAPPANALPAQIRGRNFNMSTRTVNGVREINITDGPKTIRITDENGQNINIKVTEIVGGRAKVSEYKAKDLAELKKKHATAAKLYEGYTTGANNRLNAIRNRFGNRFGRVANPPRIPNRAAPFGRVRGAQNQTAKKEIEAANTRLSKAIDKLKKLATEKTAKPDDLKKIAEEIQHARDALERANSSLE